MIKKLLLILIICGAAYYYINYGIPKLKFDRPEITAEGRFTSSDQFIVNNYENRKSNVPVKGNGVVIYLLPDRTIGGRHQQFAVKLACGHTVTIRYNVDVARPIKDIQPGYSVEFSGRYDWDAKGGTISQTYRDPKNRFLPGWLKINGVTYQ